MSRSRPTYKLVSLLLLCLPLSAALGQDGTLAPPTMKLTPSSFTVGYAAGVVFTHVTNTGGGTLSWSTRDNQTWTVCSSERKDTITITYTANTSTSQRTGTITVTSNASNSPQTITIHQGGAPVQPVLSVSPSQLAAAWNTDRVELAVRNAGNGSLSWTAASNQTWATIQSGATGKDSGKVIVALSTNPATTRRTATLTITAAGATGSPALVTLVQDSCEAAGTASLVSPADDTVLSADSVRLRWRHGVPTVSAYCLEVLGDLGSLFIADSTLTDTTFALRQLEPGMSYIWRVRPKNPTGWGSWSPVWQFSRLVNIPGAVTLLGPLDHAALSADTVRLNWRQGAPAVTRYWLEMATDTLFAFKFVDSTLVDSAYTRSSLQKGLGYVWRVRAQNVVGWGPFSTVWHFTVSLTDVAARDKETPSALRLYQNYPNPFNPSTTIRFDLPRRSHVSLTIYNTLGETIMKLAEGELDAGSHEIRFNAAGLASGVYFYRLKAGTYLHTKRLVLMR